MTGSPLRRQISVEKLEALCGEYITIKRDGIDHGELVCYNYRPEPMIRIPAFQILAVLKKHTTAEKFDYHILHLLSGKKQIMDFLIRVDESPAESLEEKDMPPMLVRLTKIKTLPENFLSDFPLFAGSSHSLKILDMVESMLRHEDPTRHNNPRIHVLLSEHSGTGQAGEFFEHALQPILDGLLGLKLDVDYDVHKTTHPRDNLTSNFARDVLLPAANQGKKRIVILCSGDGGIFDLLNGPLRQGARESNYMAPSICLMPLGTGNALYHSLHRPLKNTRTYGSPFVNALRTFLTGTSNPLPTFTATFSPGASILVNESREAIPFPPSPNLQNPGFNTLYGAVVASYGFHATLVADSDTTEYRKLGDARFMLVAMELMDSKKGGPHIYKCRVTSSFPPNDTDVSTNILNDGTKEFGYILCTPVSNLEEHFHISPESKPLDGILRAICFGNIGPEEMEKIMTLGYQDGKHVQLESVTYKAIQGLRIDLEEEGPEWKWRRFCIDGQIVAVEEGGWMDITNGGVGTELLQILGPKV